MKSRIGKPGNVYKQLAAESSNDYDEHLVTAPRDPKQVMNAQQAMRKQLELGHDTYYHIHNHAWTESKSIKYIFTYPDLIVVCTNDGVWDKIKSLLNRKDLSPVPFSYDTTLDLGDFYVPPLTVQNVEFEEKPTVLLGYLVHDRKMEETHDAFFRLVTKCLPELGK